MDDMAIRARENTLGQGSSKVSESPADVNNGSGQFNVPRGLLSDKIEFI